MKKLTFTLLGLVTIVLIGASCGTEPIVQEELESRKLIERAKGILMKTQKYTEEEAFKNIQKLAMNTRRSMKEIAEAIILAQSVN